MAKNAADRPSVFLGCFGKHPGWNDHIDDIGVETEELAELKGLLYVQGVGGNIDAGSWEALPEGGRIDGFGHVFLWRRRGSLFFGRFWSSTDGKGRSAYPMIVCAQSREPGLSWVLKTGFPKLLELETECRAAKTADEVRAAVERTLASLRASAQGAGEAARSTTAASRLAEPGLVGDSPEALERVLYIVQRELKGFLPAKGGATSVKSTDARPQHLRVPRAEPTPEESAALWGRFIAEQVARSVPILVIAPVEHAWADLIVGEPDEAQFLCVLESDSTIPPVTEVPYSIDEQHKAAGRALLERTPEQAAGVMGPSDEPRALPRPSLREAVTGIGAGIERIRSGVSEPGPNPSRTLVLGALLALVVIVALAMLIFGGDDEKESGPAESQATPASPAPSTRSADAASDPETAPATPLAATEEAAARWEALCVAYERWFLTLSREADREALAQDGFLRERVLPTLERADELSPTTIAGRGAPRLERLRSNPPPAVWEAGAVRSTRESLDAVRGVREALQATAWPARRELDEAAARLLAIGWNAGADELRRVSSSVDFESGEKLVAGISRVLSVHARVEPLLERLERIERVGRRLADTDDPLLAAFPEVVAGPGSEGEGTLAEAETRIERADSIAAQLDGFLDEYWARLDVLALRDGIAGLYERALSEGATPELFHDWLASAGREVYRLPDSPDPREGWSPQNRIEALRASIDDLIEAHGPVAGELVERYRGDLDDAEAGVAGAREGPWRRATQERITGRVEEVETALRSIDRGLNEASLRLSTDHAEYIDTLGATASVSGIGSAGIDSAWVRWRDEMLRELARPEDRLRLQEAADSARAVLERIERDASELAIRTDQSQLGGAVREQSLRRLLDDRRERLIAKGVELSAWEPDSGAAEAFDILWADEIGRERGALASIDDRLRRAAMIDRHIEAGHAPSEPLPDGETIAEIRRGWETDGIATDLRPAMEPLLDRLDRIEGYNASGDPEELARAATGGGQPLSVSLAAWRRLGEVGSWPGPDDLATEVQAQDRLAALAREIDDESRRAAVQEELTRGAATRWASAMARATGPEQARAVLARRESLGGDVDGLPFRPRFNAMAATLASDLDSASNDEAVLEALGRFVDGVGGPHAIEQLDAEHRSWMENVIDLASGGEVGPSVDFAAIGPALAGWTPEPAADGRSVVYRSPDGRVELSFVGVVIEAKTVFFARHEVSVEVFATALGDATAQEQLRDDWPALADAIRGGVSDRWQGPRSWAWDRDRGIVPGSRWLSWDEATGPAYPEGLDAGRPSGRSPMQQVSFRAASAMAEAVGCRLPTEAEWKAAMNEPGYGSPAASDGAAGWNLRDRTWSMQFDHARSRERDGLAAPWPDAGAFVPRGVGAGSMAEAERGDDDGALWFEPVDAQRGGSLRHMVGNVAEWVVLGGGGPGSDAGIGVIGGSAISDRSIPTDEAIAPPRGGGRNFADVGFRVVFGFDGVVGGSLRATAEQFLRNAPFLIGGDE